MMMMTMVLKNSFLSLLNSLSCRSQLSSQTTGYTKQAKGDTGTKIWGRKPETERKKKSKWKIRLIKEK